MQWASQDSNLGRQSQQIYSPDNDFAKPLLITRLAEIARGRGPTGGQAQAAMDVPECPHLRALIAVWEGLPPRKRRELAVYAQAWSKGGAR